MLLLRLFALFSTWKTLTSYPVKCLGQELIWPNGMYFIWVSDSSERPYDLAVILPTLLPSMESAYK